MADSKYGRLFTENDVRDLLGANVSLAEALERLGDRWEPTFPPDEPLFLLRGQDKAAPGAIAEDPETAERGNYMDFAHQEGASEEFLAAASATAQEMREWQAANPGRTKAPD